MSAWTNGKFHVVAGPKGVSVHREDGVALVLGGEQLGGEMPVKKGKAGFARVRPLAVGAAGKVLYTVGKERNLVRAEIGTPGRGVLYPFQISALAPAQGDQVLAAYVTGTKARALTSIVIGVPPADPKGKWAREFEADRPGKVEWPGELLWDKAPWSRKTRWTTDPDLLHIDANAHGYVIYDTASAVVGLLRHDAESFACVLRTPQDNGSSVAATASEQGLLVATAKGDGKAALCHFDAEGKLLAHREFAAGEVGPMTACGRHILLVVDRSELRVISADDLGEQAKLPLSQGYSNAPFATYNPLVLLQVMEDLLENNEAFRNEWESHNLKVLGLTATDLYDFYLKEPISGIDDLNGRKISAPGVLGNWLRGTGANAVDGALTTYYTDVQTGVSDGVLSLALGALPIKLYEVRV